MMPPISTLFLRAAVLFGIAGITLGIWMGIAHDFTLMPVHAHVNLIGWVTLALYGLAYRAWPTLARPRLAFAQFVIATAGAVAMTGGLAGLLSGLEGPYVAVAIGGSLATLLGMLIFAGAAYSNNG
jgi:hypothetical protein